MLRRTRLELGWDRRVALSFAQMAFPQGILLILAVVYFRIDTVLLSLLSSARQVAIYALAYKVVEFFAFLPVYFMATLFPVIARTPPRTERLKQLVSDATSSLFVAGIAVLTFLVTFAPQIVAAIAPRASYHAAIGVLRLLGIAALLIFVTNGFFQSLVALNRQRSLARLTAVVLVTNVALNCGLIPVLGADGAAWALIASEIVSLVLVLFAYREVGSLPRLTRLGRVLAATAGFGISGWLVERLLFPGARLPVLALVCGVAIAGAVYVALMRLLGALPPQLAAVLADVAERTLLVLRGVFRGTLSARGDRPQS
jgi:O-antigen/teichoic acid export membrane protein